MCAIGAALFACYLHVTRALSLPVDFDEAFNLQVSSSLVINGRYEIWYESPLLFPHQITTGPPVLLPIAGLFAITGPSLNAARAVMSLYFVGFLWLTYALSRRIAGRAGDWVFCAAVILLAFIPLWPQFALVVIGELPAVTWFLAAVALLSRALDSDHRGPALAAGVALGLGVLTKILLLIGVAGFFLALPLSAELSGRRRRAVALGACALVGLALPLVAWEVVQVAGLGWAGYADHYHRFWQLMKAGGSGLGPIPLPSVEQHLHRLAAILGKPAWQVGTGLGLAAALTVWALLRRSQPFALWTLALATVLFWGWWLRFSSWVMIRHLFAGYVLYALLLPSLGAVICAATRARLGVRSLLLAGLVAAVLLTLPPRWIPLVPPDADLRSQEFVAQLVRNIRAADPDSVFWGFGWRQAPEISFLAQIPFRDLTRQAPSARQRNYLVISRSSHVANGAPDYGKVHCVEYLVQPGWNALCRLAADAPRAVDRAVVRP